MRITSKDYEVALHLEDVGPCTAKELADVFGVAYNQMSCRVRRLKRSGVLLDNGTIDKDVLQSCDVQLSSNDQLLGKWRKSEKSDCERYNTCLGLAAKRGAPMLRCLDCSKYKAIPRKRAECVRITPPAIW